MSQPHEGALEGSLEAIISMFSGDRYGNETPEIFKQISAPTLVIHGEEDNLIELESVRHFEQNIPNELLVVISVLTLGIAGSGILYYLTKISKREL